MPTPTTYLPVCSHSSTISTIVAPCILVIPGVDNHLGAEEPAREIAAGHYSTQSRKPMIPTMIPPLVVCLAAGNGLQTVVLPADYYTVISVVDGAARIVLSNPAVSDPGLMVSVYLNHKTPVLAHC